MPRTLFETARLINRPLTLDDLDALAPMYADPEIRRYFPDGTQTREQTREEIEWIINVYYRRHGYGLWATILKETGALIGRCGLIPWQQPHGLETEVAYLLDKPYWGRGLASEAARGIIDYAFGTLGLTKLVCYVFPDNAASARVAQKAGMRFEREMVDEYGLTWVYALEKPGEPVF
jgi:[ribosomal protein S5]-alanine N-acetyltransferase